MRLRDLDATFVGNWVPKSFGRIGDAVDGAQGLLFQCPGCGAGKPVVVDEQDGSRGLEGVHYVLTWFRNPRNAPIVPDTEFPGPGRWEMSGDSIDNITLSPSVNLDIHTDEKGDPHPCHWHGWVKNGEAA